MILNYYLKDWLIFIMKSINSIYSVVVKALNEMDQDFTSLSRIIFEEIENNTDLMKLIEDSHYQERPFAYEFYHQFRKLFNKSNFVIQCEVNKCYQHIPNLNKIPDFLIHKKNFSDKGSNLAVIEFKMAHSSKSNILNDLHKLIAFRNELSYQELYEVIIGTEKQILSIKNNFSEFNNQIDIIYYNIDENKVID